MDKAASKADNSFQLILDALGLASSYPSSQQGVRVEFEKNFSIEIENREQGQCRISARVCKLAHSLHTQERQLSKALNILLEVKDSVPAETSLAISNHDNCLRCVLDIPHSATNDPDGICNRLNKFLDFSFAYKQTYIAFRDEN